MEHTITLLILKKENYITHATGTCRTKSACSYWWKAVKSHRFTANGTTAKNQQKNMVNGDVGSLEFIDLDLARCTMCWPNVWQRHVKRSFVFKKRYSHKNQRHFNRMIAELEQVALYSPSPVCWAVQRAENPCWRNVFMNWKSQTFDFRKIYWCQLCCLRGDGAASAYCSGTKKGAFTGAVDKRDG